MNKRLYKTASFLIACAMLASCSSSKMNLTEMGMKGIQLNYKPKAGSSFRYHISSSSEAAMEVMGQDQGGTSTSDATIKLQVTSIKDNTINYDLSYESVDIQTAIAGSPDPGAYEKEKLQANISIETDQYGNVLNISGTDELKKFDFGRNIDTELKDFFLIFPSKTLKIGDSWPQDNTETIFGGPLKIELTSNSIYTFSGVETYQKRECYKFSFETKSSLSGAGEQGGMELEYDGNGIGSGEIYFDYVNGLIVAGSSVTTIESIISVPSQGMDIPRTDIQNSKIELVGATIY